jgi:hypothetical protein
MGSDDGRHPSRTPGPTPASDVGAVVLQADALRGY